MIPAMTRRLLFLAFGALAWSGSAVGAPLTAAEAFALPQPAPDRAIRYGDAPRQFAELRLPEGEGPFPVAVVLHGGCWLSDYDQGYMAAFAEAIRDSGVATWTVAYRRIGEAGGGWPGTFLDVASGTDHLRELARSAPLDLDRVVAVGHSAGGHLALWLAGRHRLPDDSPLRRPDPLPVSGVLALAAAADLAWLSAEQACADAATRLIGGGPDEFPQRYRDAMPGALVPLGVPQILVNGGLDELWSRPADSYYRAARWAGDPVERRVVPEAGHFELVVPFSTSWPVVDGALEDLLSLIE